MTNDDSMTCGKGLAEHASLPAKLSALAAAMAGVLQDHLHALDLSAPESRPEQNAYETLVDDYRALASDLQQIADRMAGYRDLPMAVHDEVKMASPEALNSFAAFVRSERALLDLLQSSVERDEQMLAEMK